MVRVTSEVIRVVINRVVVVNGDVNCEAVDAASVGVILSLFIAVAGIVVTVSRFDAVEIVSSFLVMAVVGS